MCNRRKSATGGSLADQGADEGVRPHLGPSPTRSNAESADNYRAAASLCAGHAQQLGGESLLPNLMEVKG